MEYYNRKAKRMYEKYLNGEICRKVYAAVRKGDSYVVIENAEGKKWKYQLAGGGVEDCETNEEAIKREVYEELNINAEIIKSLGVMSYKTNWRYDDKEFTINNEAEVFLLEFLSYSENTQFGLDGEFTQNVKGVRLISEEDLCNDVYEFASGGIRFRK